MVDSDNETFLRKKHLRGKSQPYELILTKNQILAYMQIASAKSRSTRGASQPAFMGITTRVCPVDIVDE